MPSARKQGRSRVWMVQDFVDIDAYWGAAVGLANWRLLSGPERLPNGPHQKSVLPKANGKLAAEASRLARSGLHDSSDAGAGTDLRSDLHRAVLLPSRAKTPKGGGSRWKRWVPRAIQKVVDADLAEYFGSIPWRAVKSVF